MSALEAEFVNDMNPQAGVVLYHRTSAENARSILSDGFQNSADYFLTARTWTGVWFCASPPENEGGEVVLAVTIDIDDQELARWEWSGEGREDREWLIPANIVNQRGTIKLRDRSDHSIVAA